VIIAFHEWAALARDLWQARSWRQRLMCVIGPPGARSDVIGPATLTTSAPPIGPAPRHGEVETLSAAG
jgi:hypothetical protein